MLFTNKEIDNICEFLAGIPGAVEAAMGPHHLERLREIEVVHSGSKVQIRVTDLRELLFGQHRDSKVIISPGMLYSLFVNNGIKVKGFRPHKTHLRSMGLSIDRINELLPGSFTSKEGDGRRRGNPKKAP